VKDERRRHGSTPEPWNSIDIDQALSIDRSDQRMEIDRLFNQFVNADERGILIVGDHRRVLAMNARARRHLDYEGPLPRATADVSRSLELEFAVGDAIHDRRPVTQEMFAPDPDRILRFHVMPIMTESSETGVVMVAVDDVTRLRHLETVRRDFVANVSHELRTPIASINLLVETLQRGAIADPDAAQQFLHRIEVETQAMAHLVEELLELSRLETGALSLNLGSVDMETLIRDVIGRLSATAEEKNVSLMLDVRHELPPVRVDHRRMEQVLMNLVHNAVKFTPSGGRVTVRATRKGRSVAVDIVDTGMGMDAEQAARIFERFYKVDKGRNRGAGAGLGLAIAKHLLELHGCPMHVVSEVGRGSKFSFALPFAENPAENEARFGPIR
jgi:two-component system, OmpR family, phosphate regulon sensor histidine kinase PhoR